MANKAKTTRPGFVSGAESAERRQLTMPEAINRYLLKVESGEASPSDQDDVAKEISQRYNVDIKEVRELFAQQVTKRVRSTETRVDRIRQLTA